MYRVGIDLGGTNIVAGVVDENYRIVATAKCKTAMPRPADDILADMARVTREAVAAAGLTLDDVDGVGVGSPGVCNAETGVVERAANLGFINLPMRDKLGALLGCRFGNWAERAGGIVLVLMGVKILLEGLGVL